LPPSPRRKKRGRGGGGGGGGGAVSLVKKEKKKKIVQKALCSGFWLGSRSCGSEKRGRKWGTPLLPSLWLLEKKGERGREVFVDERSEGKGTGIVGVSLAKKKKEKRLSACWGGKKKLSFSGCRKRGKKKGNS